MNPRFGSYVRHASFLLTLSDGMIEALRLIVRGDVGDVVIMNGLERRGLVTFVAPIDDSNPFESPSRFTPTEAGRLVHKLLIEAGYYGKD